MCLPCCVSSCTNSSLPLHRFGLAVDVSCPLHSSCIRDPASEDPHQDRSFFALDVSCSASYAISVRHDDLQKKRNIQNYQKLFLTLFQYFKNQNMHISKNKSKGKILLVQCLQHDFTNKIRLLDNSLYSINQSSG
jgi:hypothetical protein